MPLHDVSNEPSQWIDFTPATTGVTSPTVYYAKYMLIGKLCFIAYDVGATSNSTAKTFTLPFPCANLADDQFFLWTFGEDAGVTLTTPGRITITNNSTTCTLYKTLSGGAWTASGTWSVVVFLFYVVA